MFYAPGEAEATCAALNRAGCVDGCASSDSDTLLYGAEAVYRTLKLQVGCPAWQRRGYTGGTYILQWDGSRSCMIPLLGGCLLGCLSCHQPDCMCGI